jgi:hypothetical protein
MAGLLILKQGYSPGDEPLAKNSDRVIWIYCTDGRITIKLEPLPGSLSTCMDPLFFFTNSTTSFNPKPDPSSFSVPGC